MDSGVVLSLAIFRARVYCSEPIEYGRKMENSSLNCLVWFWWFEMV